MIPLLMHLNNRLDKSDISSRIFLEYACFWLSLEVCLTKGGMVRHNGARLEVQSPNENVLDEKFLDHRHKYCAGCITAFSRC